MSDRYFIINALSVAVICKKISLYILHTYQQQFHMLVIRSKLRYMVLHIRYQQYIHGFEFEFQIRIV